MSSNVPLFSIFSKYPELVYGLSTKEDKPMKMHSSLDSDAVTLENREKFLQKFNISDRQLACGNLVHKNNVVAVGEKDKGKFIEDTDGLVTHQKGVFLSITVADCLPIFLYDPKKHVIGIAHAGWKGLDVHIIKNTIETMKIKYHSNPSDLLVGIGPGIGLCHFAVKEDALNRFVEYSNVVRQQNETYFLDLKNIAKQQLLQNGVKEQNVEINPLCTYCEQSTYYSYRRDKSSPIEAMLAIIGMSD